MALWGLYETPGEAFRRRLLMRRVSKCHGLNTQQIRLVLEIIDIYKINNKTGLLSRLIAFTAGGMERLERLEAQLHLASTPKVNEIKKIAAILDRNLP